MPTIRQTNFLAGELDPLLHGRTDLELFSRGLKTCRNFLISKSGAAVSRPGTEYLSDAKQDTVRLVPFVVSDSLAYVLELGEEYIRFHSDGALITQPELTLTESVGFVNGEGVTGLTSGAVGTVVSITGGVAVLESITGTFVATESLVGSIAGMGTCTAWDAEAPLEVTTPYQTADLDQLQWAQQGDILTLCHPSHPAQELRYYAETTWTFTELDFDVAASLTTSMARLKDTLPTASSSEPARIWQWGATIVTRDANGVESESAMVKVAYRTATATGANTGSAPYEQAVYLDKPVTLVFQNLDFPTVKLIAVRIYRGRGGLFGWVGDTEVESSNTASFVDVGSEPDYTRTPPKGENPFNVLDVDDTVDHTEDPYAVAFFQERRCFGGTDERGGFLFCSAVGDYANFDKRVVHVAGEGLLFELASRRREQILSMVGLDRLLVATRSSIWSVSGHDGEPLDYDSIDARLVEEVGSVGLPFLVVDGCALYARAKGVGVRGIVPANSRSGYQGIDLSTASRHLFETTSKRLVDWCYAEDPWGVVWAVRADGQLLSLTLSLEEKVSAWARHDTDGTAIAVCSVPEGDEDAVYLAVQRMRDGGGGETAITCIERMTSRVRRDDVDDDICVDQAVPYSGAVTTTISGLDVLEGQEVWCIGKDNSPQGPYTVDNGAIELDVEPTANDGANVKLWVGRLYSPDLQPLDGFAAEARLKQRTVTKVGIEVDNSRGLTVGPDFDNLEPWEQRDVEAGYGATTVSTELVETHILGDWNKNATIAIRQAEPLPVTVVGIVRELSVGD